MTDEEHIKRAIALARTAEGRVSPRPPVGALLVSPEGEVIARGATTPTPGPHAEAVALEAAGPRARGATAYVSLEPCAHTGVTPPCAEALAAAGVARVVAATLDPNPAVDGGGLDILRAAGVDVTTGVLADEAEALVEPFGHWMRTGRPLVTLKLAASLDGKVAASDGTSRWITAEPARDEVHDLRRRVDGVLVGAGTVAADDPALTCRLPDHDGRQPRRLVVDSSGRTTPDAQLFDGAAPAIVLTTEAAPGDRRRGWSERGADVVVLPAAEAGVDLHAALEALGDRELLHVLCEGGPTLAASLVAAGLVDRMRLYLAPKLIGGDAPGVLGWGVKTITDAWDLEITSSGRVGPDLRVDARPVGSR